MRNNVKKLWAKFTEIMETIGKLERNFKDEHKYELTEAMTADEKKAYNVTSNSCSICTRQFMFIAHLNDGNSNPDDAYSWGCWLLENGIRLLKIETAVYERMKNN